MSQQIIFFLCCTCCHWIWFLHGLTILDFSYLGNILIKLLNIKGTYVQEQRMQQGLIVPDSGMALYYQAIMRVLEIFQKARFGCNITKLLCMQGSKSYLCIQQHHFFWTFTCNTDHNEVSVSAKPLSAHKSRQLVSSVYFVCKNLADISDHC